MEDETQQQGQEQTAGLDQFTELEAIEDAGKPLAIKHPVSGAVLGHVLVGFIGSGSYLKELHRLRDIEKKSHGGSAYNIPAARDLEIQNKAAIGTLALYFWGFRETTGGPFIPNRADGTYNTEPPVIPNLNGKGRQIGMKVDMKAVNVGNLKMVYAHREVRRQVDAFATVQEAYLAQDNEDIAGN